MWITTEDGLDVINLDHVKRMAIRPLGSLSRYGVHLATGDGVGTLVFRGTRADARSVVDMILDCASQQGVTEITIQRPKGEEGERGDGTDPGK